MKHLFSSGEVMYKKNEKDLPEGLLLGTTLEYDEVEPDTRYICRGIINDQEVEVHFTLSLEELEDIKNRYRFRILMQSDILSAKWNNYSIIRIG